MQNADQITIPILKYIGELDAFLPSDQYMEISGLLEIQEWTPVVWICRLLILDNDYGEHLFDNWNERELLEKNENWKKYEDIGSEAFLIINPDSFQNGKDGPCNTPEFRKQFWTEVLKSMQLSLDLLFKKAREWHGNTKEKEIQTIIKKYI